MILKSDAEETALIAQEIGAEVIRGPVRYPAGEDRPRSPSTLVQRATEIEGE